MPRRVARYFAAVAVTAAAAVVVAAAAAVAVVVLLEVDRFAFVSSTVADKLFPLARLQKHQILHLLLQW